MACGKQRLIEGVLHEDVEPGVKVKAAERGGVLAKRVGPAVGAVVVVVVTVAVTVTVTVVVGVEVGVVVVVVTVVVGERFIEPVLHALEAVLVAHCPGAALGGGDEALEGLAALRGE